MRNTHASAITPIKTTSGQHNPPREESMPQARMRMTWLGRYITRIPRAGQAELRVIRERGWNVPADHSIGFNAISAIFFGTI